MRASVRVENPRTRNESKGYRWVPEVGSGSSRGEGALSTDLDFT
jgi:hypothetical protein